MNSNKMALFTPSISKHIAAMKLARSVENKRNLAFLSRLFIQVNLPHSNQDPERIWQRQNGNLTMVLNSFVYRNRHRQEHSVGLPYGIIPRMFLFWLGQQVVRTKSRKVYLGDNLSDFMNSLGLLKNGTYIRILNEQMKRLLTTRITFQQIYSFSEEAETYFQENTLNMFIAQGHSSLYGKDKHFLQEITLDENFYNALRFRPVPLNLDILKEIKKSPLRLDLYAWLTYRIFTLPEEGQLIPWLYLKNQFGAEYGRMTHFKQKVRRMVEQICSIHTSLNLSIEKEGIHIYPSTLLVNPQQLDLSYPSGSTKG